MFTKNSPQQPIDRTPPTIAVTSGSLFIGLLLIDNQMEKFQQAEFNQQQQDPHQPPVGVYPNLAPPPYVDVDPSPSAPPSMVGGGPSETVVTVLVDDGKYGPYPKTMRCHHCQQQIATQTQTKAGPLTYLLCITLCIVGCFCGCCLIPFCTRASQDVMHRCPKCKNFLGAYERCKLRR